jgi:hypothetical protein
MPDTHGMAQTIQQVRRRRRGHFPQRQAQKVLVKEHQCFARFFEAADGVLLCFRDMFEKAHDIGRTQLARMPFAVKQDVATCPCRVPLPGSPRPKRLSATARN